MSFFLLGFPYMEQLLVHALNRGVDKRDIFMDDHDRRRFAYGLMIFNDEKAIDMAALKIKGLPMSFSIESGAKRKRLVDIHGWCLMRNHYHLLLSPRVENGISLFLQKLNIGYVKYFNDRHQRQGTLYQGRTKQVTIARDAHFLHILNYIHLNPLDFHKGSSEWRERSIGDMSGALAHLQKYRWSSYADYCGAENFPAIVTTRLFSSSPANYARDIKSYLRQLDAGALDGMVLE